MPYEKKMLLSEEIVLFCIIHDCNAVEECLISAEIGGGRQRVVHLARALYCLFVIFLQGERVSWQMISCYVVDYSLSCYLEMSVVNFSC